MKGLEKWFGDNKIFEGIDLDMKKGEVVSIIGSSGSGKTTLLRCVNLLEPFQAGTIFIDGNEVGYRIVNGHRRRQPESVIARQRVLTGMVFQNFNLFPHMTAVKNVMLGLTKVKKMSRKDARELSAGWLERVGLKDKMESYPS